MPEITLRPPQLGDAAGIHQLVRCCGPLDINSQYLYLLLCHHYAQTCAVAERGGVVVGFVSAYRPPVDPETLFIWQVAVAPQERGQRLAFRLIEHILSRPGSVDVCWLEATVSPSNVPSQALFQSLTRELGTQCCVSPLFTEQLLSGAEAHESEELYRIGPFARPRFPEEKQPDQ